MIKMLASGACSAHALARSRTMEALVLKRSYILSIEWISTSSNIPSRVIPGFLGTPAGIKTTSAPVKASLRAVGVLS